MHIEHIHDVFSPRFFCCCCDAIIIIPARRELHSFPAYYHEIAPLLVLLRVYALLSCIGSGRRHIIHAREDEVVHRPSSFRSGGRDGGGQLIFAVYLSCQLCLLGSRVCMFVVIHVLSTTSLLHYTSFFFLLLSSSCTGVGCGAFRKERSIVSCDTTIEPSSFRNADIWKHRIPDEI